MYAALSAQVKKAKLIVISTRLSLPSNDLVALIMENEQYANSGQNQKKS